MTPPVHQNCSFGKGCVISDEARLVNVTCGDNVTINAGASLNNVVIGDGSKISRQVVLYSANPDEPVIIGKDVWISHGVFGEATGGRILIGDYAVIAHFSVLLTSSGPGSKSYVMNELFPLVSGNVSIGKHCWIGTQCTLLPGVSLDEGTVIGSNSLVKEGNWGPWAVYAGSPVRYIRKINRESDIPDPVS